MDTLILAQQLLDSEFDEFEHNPSGYVQALGWSTLLQKKVISIADKISPSREDYINLKFIIDSQLEITPKATTIDIAECNKVSDFLCNCVAGKINKALKL